MSADIVQRELQQSVWTNPGDVLWTPRKAGVPCSVTLEVVFMVGKRARKQTSRTGKFGEAKGSRGACSDPQRMGLNHLPVLLCV